MCKEFRVNGTMYLAQIDNRTGTTAVTSCHPYDDQKYHWARRSERTGNWIVYRNGETISAQSKSLTDEDIAEYMEKLNRTLKPIMCYN